jgi:hypothetical protein
MVWHQKAKIAPSNKGPEKRFTRAANCLAAKLCRLSSNKFEISR